MKHILIALLLTGCAASAPVPVSEALPSGGAFGAIVRFDPSVPTRWVEDHQGQFAFGGVKSIEHLSMRHAEVGGRAGLYAVDFRTYEIQTRDRGVLYIGTEEESQGGERVTSVFTGSEQTNDLVFICQRGTC